jgi:hypothetical protein
MAAGTNGSHTAPVPQRIKDKINGGIGPPRARRERRLTAAFERLVAAGYTSRLATNQA